MEYTGTMCSAQLLALQSCIPGRESTSVVYISSTIDQTTVESQVSTTINGLGLLQPSMECQAVVVPFLCLFYFGLCDDSGMLYGPSSETCVTLSTDTCQREWAIAVQILGENVLPMCDTFEETDINC